jgi:hypothetical protein
MIEFRSKHSKSTAPGGYGSIDRKGYRRISVNNKLVREHILVWRHFKGTIPKGMEIHHKDGDKLNNEIDNLELIDSLSHRHLHAGYETRADGLYKRCFECREVKLVSQYTPRKIGVEPKCKKCRVIEVQRWYQARKADLVGQNKRDIKCTDFF